MHHTEVYLKDDPQWYKDAIIYELHIRAFYDSNADGIGDIQGALEKLDYLADLGVTALWLLPFYPSPLKDDGYDITNYFCINPDYGDTRTFRRFLRDAHKRDLRVITEMVINHTSDQHPWFQRARRAKPGSVWRNFYVWSDTADKYRDARIIFQDFEKSNWTWDPEAQAYYWHRFYQHQPDLNYDNPAVQKAVLRAIDFWFEMGVDGMRLDAIPYLYEREGTNCENLPETHAFLKKLRIHIDANFKDKMLLAEANQWPEDAVAYFGSGDESHMAFHFPLMPRMFMAIQMEDRFPIVDILEQTPPIPVICQWALFLRNHDELTLEMVTDEERDYMYMIYAKDPKTKINLGIRRRLAPLLGNDRRKIELMNTLLLSLPGTPIIYYGDEIGMGDNYYLGDRDGVRTPMQWNDERNAGFSQADPRGLYLPVIASPEYHYKAVNVAREERDQFSLMWWVKHTLAMRKRFKSLSRGDLKFLFPSNPKILAFIRRYEGETALIVVNLSRVTQYTELDLSDYAGLVPYGLFSGNRFHRVENEPYQMILGPYDYYWFTFKEEKALLCITSQGVLPKISITGWPRLMDEAKDGIESDVLPKYLRCCKWFGGVNRTIRKVTIQDSIPISKGALSYLIILSIDYTEGLPEMYLLPISFALKDKAERVREMYPHAIISWLKTGAGEGVIYDGTYDEELRQNLLAMTLQRRKARGEYGGLVFHSRKVQPSGPEETRRSSEVLKAEESESIILFKDRFFLKLFRTLEEGTNHGIDISRFLYDHGFANIPPFEGYIEYRHEETGIIQIGVLQGFVPNEGDAWRFTLDELDRYFDVVLSRRDLQPPKPPEVLQGTQSAPPEVVELAGGVYLEMIKLLGRRTGEMHLTLASSKEVDFDPEPFSALYQRSVYQSMRVSAYRVLELLRRSRGSFPDDLKRDASEVLSMEREIMEDLRAITGRKIDAKRTRIHGDYRLDKLLYTGKDFYIAGFNSSHGYTLAQKKIKRSPLRDIASMVVSLHMAARTALTMRETLRPEDMDVLRAWCNVWTGYVSGIFVGSYIETIKSSPFMPGERYEIELLMKVFLLDRSIYGLGESLDSGEGVPVALAEIKQLIGRKKEKEISPPEGAG